MWIMAPDFGIVDIDDEEPGAGDVEDVEVDAIDMPAEALAPVEPDAPHEARTTAVTAPAPTTRPVLVMRWGSFVLVRGLPAMGTASSVHPCGADRFRTTRSSPPTAYRMARGAGQQQAAPPSS